MFARALSSSCLPSSSLQPPCNSSSQASHYFCFKNRCTKQDVVSKASDSSPAASTSCSSPDVAVTKVIEATQGTSGDADAMAPCVVTEHCASLRRFSSANMHDVRQVFAQFDANHDGKISTDELCSVLKSLGIETSQEDAKCMIEEVDANGDGFIDLQEFMDLHREHMQVMAQEELEATFEMFDLNKDGHISAQELHVVLSKLGKDRHTSLEDCKSMICRVDRKGVGHVDLDDFKLMMMRA